MRVGLLIYGDLDHVSGGYLYDRKLVEQLRRKGDRVEIISLPWRRYAHHLWDNLSDTLRRRLERAALDVLLEDELNHPSLFWLNRRLSRRVAYPLIAIVHHLRSSETRPAWQNRMYRWVEKCFLLSVKGFVFNSATTASAVAQVIPSIGPAIVARPGGDRLNPRIDATEIMKRVYGKTPLRVLFVGNVIPRKNLNTLVAALSRLPKDTWRLEVIGNLMTDSTYVNRLRRQIDQAGLTSQIVFSGVSSDQYLASRYADSHVLAVPSSYEGFGIVYLEAMGFGVPVIASQSGAASELITTGQNGFLIPRDDAEGLARCLEHIHRDRKALARISLAALRTYRKHPTWAACGERIRDFLMAVSNSEEGDFR
jgi:glycosyltransferase involved in cell wall biosynthesis